MEEAPCGPFVVHGPPAPFVVAEAPGADEVRLLGLSNAGHERAEGEWHPPIPRVGALALLAGLFGPRHLPFDAVVTGPFHPRAAAQRVGDARIELKTGTVANLLSASSSSIPSAKRMAAPNITDRFCPARQWTNVGENARWKSTAMSYHDPGTSVSSRTGKTSDAIEGGYDISILNAGRITPLILTSFQRPPAAQTWRASG